MAKAMKAMKGATPMKAMKGATPMKAMKKVTKSAPTPMKAMKGKHGGALAFAGASRLCKMRSRKLKIFKRKAFLEKRNGNKIKYLIE